MKRLIVFTSLLDITMNCFCQQKTPSQTFTHEDYLKKSKRQKTTAWTFLGVGATLFMTGLVIPQGEEAYGVPISDQNDGVKDAFLLTGSLSMLGSIPLFIASGRNKKKAMAASANFQMKRSPVLQNPCVVNRPYPVVSIKISL
jgi:hypothetical protein